MRFGCAAFDVAGLLVVATVAKLLESPLFIQFFLQTAQGAFDQFTFFHADFGIQLAHPLSLFDGCIADHVIPLI